MSFKKPKDVHKAVERYIKETKVAFCDGYESKTRQFLYDIMSHEAFANPDYNWSLNDFELGHRLGRGKFGRVYIAREKNTGYIVAIKTLNKCEIVEHRVEKLIIREIEIQSHLKHPNVLQLLTWFHDDFRIYLVLDYAYEGEIYKILKSSEGGHFSDIKAAKYTYQVACALEYCHANRVIHRDIKPENLLLTSGDNVKLADFGWSVRSTSLLRQTMCGTLDYLAPEMIEQRAYSTYVDLWCLGVLCYEFVVGSPPFESDNQEQTYAKIKNVHFKYPSHVSEGAKNLISKLLVYNAKNRMTLAEVKNHPWIKQYKSES